MQKATIVRGERSGLSFSGEQRMSYMRRMLLPFIGVALLAACSNPFAPEKQTPEGTTQQPAPAAETPQLLIDNLHRAMRDRDKDLYETLLDERF